MYPQQDYHFLHVTKAGGKLFKSIVKQGISDSSVSVMCHDHVVRWSDIPRGSRIIIGIRDPKRRFISGYYSPLRHVGGVQSVLPPPLRNFYRAFPTVEDAIEAFSGEGHKKLSLGLNQHLGKYLSLSYWLGREPCFKNVFFYETESLVDVYGSKGFDQRTHTTPDDYQINASASDRLDELLHAEYGLYLAVKENAVNILSADTNGDMLANLKFHYCQSG